MLKSYFYKKKEKLMTGGKLGYIYIPNKCYGSSLRVYKFQLGYVASKGPCTST